MRYLIKIALLAALFMGGLYFFFRDTTLARHLLPLAAAKADDTVEEIFARKAREHMSFYRTPDLAQAGKLYREAITEKYAAMRGDADDPNVQLTMQQYLAGKKAEYLRTELQRYDQNDNGQLERAEWPDNLLFRFSAEDVNNDSIVTQGELAVGAQEESSRVFVFADRNRDKNLSEGEFFVSRGGEKAVQEALQTLDYNKDTKVSVDELSRFVESAQFKP